MEFRTKVEITPNEWKIEPRERMLFVGSCFADNMGKRFQENKFRATVNPYGVMYNPASVLHTVERLCDERLMPFDPDKTGTAVFTLGTNHVYILKETGEIVDNCRKRPQCLFEERTLGVGECVDYLRKAIRCIHQRFPLVRFVLTVSPIRYKKYGYHGSRVSKATLLLAIDKLLDSHATPNHDAETWRATYFPAYEIVDDELRDYRFYAPDMLHPTEQAVDYIYECMAETFFSEATINFIKAWRPIKDALAHKPFNPDSEEYQAFLKDAKRREQELMSHYE